MKTDDKIRDEKLQYDINREKQKYWYYHLEKLINMNSFQVKKCFLLIKDKQQNKPSLYILLQKKLLKNKQKNKLVL